MCSLAPALSLREGLGGLGGLGGAKEVTTVREDDGYQREIVSPGWD